MAHPGAWRASLLLSDLLGGVPWRALRSRGDRPAERVDPTPALLEQPNPPDTRMATFSALALDLIWHGNAVAVVADRDRHGHASAVVPVAAEQVAISRAESGAVRYGIGSGAGQRWYGHDDVLHVKGPSRPGALRGMGVLECHLDGALRLSADLARQAGGVAEAGVPSVWIKSSDPDLTAADAAELKAAFLRSQRTRSPAVTNSGTSIEPLSWNPSETQLLEAREFSVGEIALIFGLDPSWLGVSRSSRVYSNIEGEAINLVKFSLGGHLARFEQAFSAHLPRGTSAKANLDALLRADTRTRYESHARAIEAGFLTVDEVRALEDRPPLTAAQRAEMAARAPVAPRPGPGRAGDEDDQGERDGNGEGRPGGPAGSGTAQVRRPR
ncbi:Phage portal protein [Pseudonocardia sp. Ae168_Ps1]|uniref:phage portal protein n=1 Tax=unclassified Pseudonocardia TaxID=2619320 RepID=UPI00095A7E1A|nr:MULTISPECIES: phage portal protein [unclassified Pseudonocardia]OLL69849.1 Phage portal protein [Pseudonocardia sp. Ae150A_Ps1]OLL69982.1 Phage portal protein [Pseudonocardia sp. Ae168_Ps1]